MIVLESLHQAVKILKEEEKIKLWKLYLIAFSHPSSLWERVKFALYKGAGCEISRCSERCISVLRNEI